MSKIINNLNKLLKGEYMAIDKYDNYIEEVDNHNIKNEFQKIQQNHKEQALEIAERIQQLGGNPINGSGIQGIIFQAASTIRDMNGISNEKIIQEAYDGEKIGINITCDILNNISDNESRDVINNLINENNNTLDTLEELINTSNFN